MSAKRIFTISLLLFVIASLAWLGVKEVRHSRAVKAAQEVPSPPPAPTVQPALPVPATIASPAPREVKAPPRPVRASTPTAPAAKNPAPGSSGALSTAPAMPAPVIPLPPASAKSKVIVYYLHTTVRCANCLRIEAYAASAVTGGFSGPLAEGRLEWKVLNVDEPPNAHYVQDYQLFTKSVVVSEVKDGKEVRWKRLDKVWDLLGDQQAFERYVKDEVKAYLGDT